MTKWESDGTELAIPNVYIKTGRKLTKKVSEKLMGKEKDLVVSTEGYVDKTGFLDDEDVIAYASNILN